MKSISVLAMTGALAAFVALPLDSVAQQSSQKQQSQQREQQKQQRQAKQQGQDQAVVVGEVIDTRTVNIVGGGDAKHRLIKVRPQQGRNVVVDVGPVNANQNVPKFKKGQRIIAVGKSARINEQPVIYAMTVGELYPAGRGAAGTQMAQAGQQQRRQQQ